jgi:hypothetical protein
LVSQHCFLDNGKRNSSFDLPKKCYGRFYITHDWLLRSCHHTKQILAMETYIAQPDLQYLIRQKFYFEIYNRNFQKYAWPFSPRICIFPSLVWCSPQAFVVAPKIEANVFLRKAPTYKFSLGIIKHYIISTSTQCSTRSDRQIKRNFLKCNHKLFAQSLNKCPTGLGISILKVTATTP